LRVLCFIDILCLTKKQLKERRMSETAIEWDAEADRMQYANAGHPHAFRVRQDGTTDRLGATTPPLGLAETPAASAAEAPWKSCCDRLVLFTDGVSDARNEDGERFGEERVLEVVRQFTDESSSEVLDAILEELDAFRAVPNDDKTLLILRT